MPSTNKTDFLELNQYIGTDQQKREDYNSDMQKLDDFASGAAGHSPYIGPNGNWFEWDPEIAQHVDTGIAAAGKSFIIKGTYPTLTALQAAVPSPSTGDMYNIGTADPYNTYMWDGVALQWINQGVALGVPDAKLAAHNIDPTAHPNSAKTYTSLAALGLSAATDMSTTDASGNILKILSKLALGNMYIESFTTTENNFSASIKTLLGFPNTVFTIHITKSANTDSPNPIYVYPNGVGTANLPPYYFTYDNALSPAKLLATQDFGTWTINLEGATAVGTNTYSARTGYFVRTGKHVHLSGRFTLTAVDPAMVGNLRITGLPFAPLRSYEAISVGAFTGITFADGYTALGGYTATGNYLSVVKSGPGKTFVPLTPAEISNSTTIVFSVEYEIA